MVFTYRRIPWEVPWLEPTSRVCCGKHRGPYPHFFYWRLMQRKAIKREMKSVLAGNISDVTGNKCIQFWYQHQAPPKLLKCLAETFVTHYKKNLLWQDVLHYLACAKMVTYNWRAVYHRPKHQLTTFMKKTVNTVSDKATRLY